MINYISDIASTSDTLETIMNNKQQVAEHAAHLVKEGMTVGLGTGSTADYFIAALARRSSEEGLQINTVASSVISMMKAKELGLPLIAIEQLTQLDLYVDGADEVTPDNTLLKGQGADLVKEKLLATASEQFIVLVDASKMVTRIGERFAIPIEVMPFAWQLVKQQLEDFGGQSSLRQNSNNSGLAVSSYGSLILDMVFDPKLDSAQLNKLLNNTPGIIEHGIFHKLANLVLLGSDEGIQEIVS